MKRILSLVLITSILSVVLGAVGFAKPIEIDMWIMPNSNKPAGDLEDVLKNFHRKNRNIKVKITALDWGAAWPKITTAATSGDVPDIVQLGSTWVSAISAMGVLEDFSEQVKSLGGKDAFLPSAWRTAGLEGSGQVTALPWIVDARAMYYRTDVFRQLDIKPEDLDTWEGFVTVLDKIKQADLTIDGVKVRPLGIPGKNDWNVVHNLAPFIWGAGGSFLNEDFSQSTLHEEKAVAGMDFYVDLVRKGFVPLECLEQNTAQVSTDFDNGHYAIVFDGPYKLKSLTTPAQRGGALSTIAAKKFGILPYPAGPAGRFTYVGGSNLAVFSGSKNKKEAWKVLEYLASPEAQVAYSKASGFLPANQKAFDDPYFVKDVNRKVYVEAVKYGRAYPAIPTWGLLEPAMMKRFGIMWDHFLDTVR